MSPAPRDKACDTEARATPHSLYCLGGEQELCLGQRHDGGSEPAVCGPLPKRGVAEGGLTWTCSAHPRSSLVSGGGISPARLGRCQQQRLAQGRRTNRSRQVRGARGVPKTRRTSFSQALGPQSLLACAFVPRVCSVQVGAAFSDGSKHLDRRVPTSATPHLSLSLSQPPHQAV